MNVSEFAERRKMRVELVARQIADGIRCPHCGNRIDRGRLGIHHPERCIHRNEQENAR